MRIVWKYIRDNNLQNPDNRREILCDAKLKSVLHQDRVDMMEIAKSFTSHMIQYCVYYKQEILISAYPNISVNHQQLQNPCSFPATPVHVLLKLLSCSRHCSPSLGDADQSH